MSVFDWSQGMHDLIIFDLVFIKCIIKLYIIVKKN